jgi:hypothetical protein
MRALATVAARLHATTNCCSSPVAARMRSCKLLQLAESLFFFLHPTNAGIGARQEAHACLSKRLGELQQLVAEKEAAEKDQLSTLRYCCMRL